VTSPYSVKFISKLSRTQAREISNSGSDLSACVIQQAASEPGCERDEAKTRPVNTLDLSEQHYGGDR